MFLTKLSNANQNNTIRLFLSFAVRVFQWSIFTILTHYLDCFCLISIIFGGFWKFVHIYLNFSSPLSSLITRRSLIIYLTLCICRHSFSSFLSGIYSFQSSSSVSNISISSGFNNWSPSKRFWVPHRARVGRTFNLVMGFDLNGQLGSFQLGENKQTVDP